MSDTILVTNNLTKKYGDKLAVDSASISIRKGAIFGLIGMNGAGKTTIMKMISGMVKPTSGDYDYTGFDCKKEDAFSRIGALIEAPAIYPNMSAYDNMKMKCLAYGINSKEYIEEKLKLVGLGYTGKKKAGKFSLGMKQRVGIAMALLGKPKLLILDEPINGLDADGVRIVREVLLDITKNKECSVLISSHILGELEKIATHYGIIRNGKMIREMTSEELENDCPIYIALKTKNINKSKSKLLDKYSRVEEDEEGYLRVYDDVAVEDVVVYLYDNGIIVEEIRTDKISLEEYYINLMNSKEGK